MMRTSKVKVVLTAVLTMLCCVCLFFAVNPVKVKAADEFGSLKMDTGASIKITENGGLRMRAVFDKTAYDNLQSEGTDLYFVVMSESEFAGAKTENGYDFAKEFNYKPLKADKTKIYTNGKGDYFSNCLLDYGNNENLYKTNYCVVSYITDGDKTQYATFDSESQVTKNLYNVVNSALLDGENSQELVGQLATTYSFMGKGSFPLTAFTETQYATLVQRINDKVLTPEVAEVSAGINKAKATVTDESVKITYNIDTASDFYNFLLNITSYRESDTVLLNADIDGTSYNNNNGALKSGNDRYFYGTFDGQGHIISNFNFNYTDGGALFGDLGKLSPSGENDKYSGHLKNFALTGVNITDSTNPHAPLLVLNLNNESTISNVFVEGKSSNKCGLARLRSADATVSNVIVSVTFDEDKKSEAYAVGYGKNSSKISNVYAVTNANFAADGTPCEKTVLYDSIKAFLKAKNSLTAEDGWADFWDLQDYSLSFNDKLLFEVNPLEDTEYADIYGTEIDSVEKITDSTRFSGVSEYYKVDLKVRDYFAQLRTNFDGIESEKYYQIKLSYDYSLNYGYTVGLVAVNGGVAGETSKVSSTNVEANKEYSFIMSGAELNDVSINGTKNLSFWVYNCTNPVIYLTAPIELKINGYADIYGTEVNSIEKVVDSAKFSGVSEYYNIDLNYLRGSGAKLRIDTYGIDENKTYQIKFSFNYSANQPTYAFYGQNVTTEAFLDAKLLLNTITVDQAYSVIITGKELLQAGILGDTDLYFYVADTTDKHILSVTAPIPVLEGYVDVYGTEIKETEKVSDSTKFDGVSEYYKISLNKKDANAMLKVNLSGIDANKSYTIKFSVNYNINYQNYLFYTGEVSGDQDYVLLPTTEADKEYSITLTGARILSAGLNGDSHFYFFVGGTENAVLSITAPIEVTA